MSEGGNLETEVEKLRRENEELRRALAAANEALVIEEGKVYVIEVEGHLSVDHYERLRDIWERRVGQKPIILTGAHVARARE